MDTKLVNMLRTAVEDSADDNGWAHLGSVGQNIANKSPEFDPRNFGYKKLLDLVRAIDLFEIDVRGSENSPAKAIYIRTARNTEKQVKPKNTQRRRRPVTRRSSAQNESIGSGGADEE